MPEFELVTVREVKRLIALQRHQRYIDVYLPLIQQVESQPGAAGRLRPVAGEKPFTIRTQLKRVADILGLPLSIRRIRQDVYFCFESVTSPAPRRRRRQRGQTTQPADSATE